MRAAGIVATVFFSSTLAAILAIWYERSHPTPPFAPVEGWRGVPGFFEDGTKDPKHPRWHLPPDLPPDLPPHLPWPCGRAWEAAGLPL